MEPPAPGSEPPVEEDRIQEHDPNSNSNASSPGAAAPPPPPATPLHLEQAGGGADGSSPATQYNSLRAEEAMYQKEQEKVVVKVRPKQDKLPQVKGKSLWSRVKNKIFCGKVREICSEHVKHQIVSSCLLARVSPPPPRATPLHLDQAGGGADGSTSATVVDPRKGKETLLPRDIPPPPSPTDYAGGGADGSSSAAAWVQRKGRLAAVPFPAPFPPSSAGSIPDFGAGGSSSSAGRRMVVPRDATLPFDYTRVVQQAVESPHAKDAVPGKEKEKLRQVKVRPRPEKGKSPWSWLKNKFNQGGLSIMWRPRVEEESRANVGGSTHVLVACGPFRNLASYFEADGYFVEIAVCKISGNLETQPISEVRNRYMVSSNGMNSLDGYSEFRPEQVVDRPDTDEERRFLDVVETASARHADLRWNSKFPRSSREMHNCLTVVACRHSFRQCWHKLKFEAYCEVNNLIVTMALREIYLQRKNRNIMGK
ncbi:hypothetical protein TRIUR3_33132 [Triticum urartu]|uniref:Uncharacterized protein n=1 Tax=Triticum urartu TaxID=4572 RepID=M7Z6P6_TRIUA|nr:hypothetical protein TRIUR3_33132 [Triticum urartu]